MAVIGGRNVGNNDLAVMGAGALMFIDSFLPWYGVSAITRESAAASVSGWHFFWTWLSIILVLRSQARRLPGCSRGRTLPPVARRSSAGISSRRRSAAWSSSSC